MFCFSFKVKLELESLSSDLILMEIIHPKMNVMNWNIIEWPTFSWFVPLCDTFHTFFRIQNIKSFICSNYSICSICLQTIIISARNAVSALVSFVTFLSKNCFASLVKNIIYMSKKKHTIKYHFCIHV